MKQIIFTLSLSLLFILNSCNSDDTELNSSNSRIEKVLAEKDYETQKLMYAMLDANEKHKIWNDKIETILKNGNLNRGQIELIKDLKRHMNVGLFDETVKNDQREIFKYVYVKDFLKKSEKLFDRDYIYLNFFSLSNRTALPEFGQLPNCTCNKGSMWSCAMATSDCSSASCTVKTSECGFAGMFECNGKCFS